MTDPQTAADAAERVQAFLDARRATGDTRKTIASVEPDPCAIPARIVRLIEADVRMLLEDRKRMAAELEQVRRERAADDEHTAMATSLVYLLVSSAPCRLDRFGNCLTHGEAVPVGGDCPHALAKAFLAGAKAHRSAAMAASAAPDATGDTQTREQRADGLRDLTKLEGPQRGSQGRAEFESFLTDASRRAVAEFFAEAAQESDDFDIDAVIAQNHADAARDWGIDDGPTP